MNNDLKVYYTKRIATERELADAAASPLIADIHRELASRYAKLTQSPESEAEPQTAH